MRGPRSSHLSNVADNKTPGFAGAGGIWAGLALTMQGRLESWGSFQVSMDVHDSGSGFENSGRVSAGPASLNYSVDLCHRNGHLQFSGWSEHNSQALLQVGFPGEAHISAALQTEGKADRHCSWPAGRSPYRGGGGACPPAAGPV